MRLMQHVRVLLSLSALVLLWPHECRAQTLKVSATLTIEKGDDKAKMLEDAIRLADHAKNEKGDQKYHPNLIVMLQNTVEQLKKVQEAAAIIAAKDAEVPTIFAKGAYRVKAMPKLKAKKATVKTFKLENLQRILAEGKGLSFDEPLLVKNATALFREGDWDFARRHWTADRIMKDPYLEKEFRVDYMPPDRAKMRLQGNYLIQQEPDRIAFSRYMATCFHGTPAKPKLPGQNTEHCEQTISAELMTQDSTKELTPMMLFPGLNNTFPYQHKFRLWFVEAGRKDLPKMLGKNAEKWMAKYRRYDYRFFVLGPSGSGDKLHAENGLPFYDVMLHGSRRWLLLGEDELQRVAEKAKEALEFDKTTAYMFFEEKLPELVEEFGLKKYVEANQDAGDVMFVPSGWFRVSVALADSISFYETLLAEKRILKLITEQNIWKPQMHVYQVAFCHKPEELKSLPGIQDPKQLKWLEAALQKAKNDEVIGGILTALVSCGSVLTLEDPLPHLTPSKLSVCSPKIWSLCRSRLKEVLAKEKKDASLDWLPEKAPTAVPPMPGDERVRTEL